MSVPALRRAALSASARMLARCQPCGPAGELVRAQREAVLMALSRSIGRPGDLAAAEAACSERPAGSSKQP